MFISFRLFFLMARKSNLVPASVHKFDSREKLAREKIVLNGDIVIVLRFAQLQPSNTCVKCCLPQYILQHFYFLKVREWYQLLIIDTLKTF